MYTALKDTKFKDGTTLAKGTSVTVTYSGNRDKSQYMTLNHDGTTHTVSIEKGYKFLKGYPKPPSMATLEKWSDEGIGKTPRVTKRTQTVSERMIPLRGCW